MRSGRAKTEACLSNSCLRFKIHSRMRLLHPCSHLTSQNWYHLMSRLRLQSPILALTSKKKKLWTRLEARSRWKCSQWRIRTRSRNIPSSNRPRQRRADSGPQMFLPARCLSRPLFACPQISVAAPPQQTQDSSSWTKRHIKETALSIRATYKQRPLHRLSLKHRLEPSMSSSQMASRRPLTMWLSSTGTPSSQKLFVVSLPCIFYGHHRSVWMAYMEWTLRHRFYETMRSWKAPEDCTFWMSLMGCASATTSQVKRSK